MDNNSELCWPYRHLTKPLNLSIKSPMCSVGSWCSCPCAHARETYPCCKKTLVYNVTEALKKDTIRLSKCFKTVNSADCVDT